MNIRHEIRKALLLLLWVAAVSTNVYAQDMTKRVFKLREVVVTIFF